MSSISDYRFFLQHCANDMERYKITDRFCRISDTIRMEEQVIDADINMVMLEHASNIRSSSSP